MTAPSAGVPQDEAATPGSDTAQSYRSSEPEPCEYNAGKHCYHPEDGCCLCQRSKYHDHAALEEGCTGASDCPAPMHVHGCYADINGPCDDPDDHAVPAPVVPEGEAVCRCSPCPGRGNDGHGMTHCAECCFGSGVEVESGCPVHDPTFASMGAPVGQGAGLGDELGIAELMEVADILIQHGRISSLGLAKLDDWLADRVRAAKEEAWDECVEETWATGWLHDFAKSDALARNPYRAALAASPVPTQGGEESS